MTTLQLFYYVVLPLSLAVVGVVYGEIFRARQMRAASSEEMESSIVGGKNSGPNRRLSRGSRKNANSRSMGGSWSKIEETIVAHISGTVVLAAVAGAIAAGVALLRIIHFV